MKNLYLCLILLILSASCSNDLNTVEESSSSTDIINANSTNAELTSNSTNPYEIVGQLYDQLSKNYYAENNLPSTTNDIVKRVEMVVQNNSDFNELKGIYYQPVTAERVQYIAQHHDIFLTEVLGNSSLSTNGKSSLGTFVASLALFIERGTTGDALCQFVLQYEKTIINNPLLTANDKKIILVTTSIARHSLPRSTSTYTSKNEPKKNTDPDWGVLVGNIIATTEGTDESIAKAISLSLAVSATIDN